MPRALRIVAASLIASGFLAAAASPAAASCVAAPVASEHRFSGTVLSVERDGRVATVRTDDGKTVLVRGTTSDGGVTSVDRSYVVGARYEFHPVNTTSPYEDNACTATRQIAAVPAGAGGGPAPRAGGTPTGTALALAGLAVLAFATVGLIRMARRPWAAGRPAPR